MHKHTPGPWHAVDDYGTWEIESANYAVATVNHNRPQHEANARLIATAPELLKLLESCIRVMQRADEISMDARYYIELATLAIAKAKGTTDHDRGKNG